MKICGMGELAPPSDPLGVGIMKNGVDGPLASPPPPAGVSAASPDAERGLGHIRGRARPGLQRAVAGPWDEAADARRTFACIRGCCPGPGLALRPGVLAPGRFSWPERAVLGVPPAVCECSSDMPFLMGSGQRSRGVEPGVRAWLMSRKRCARRSASTPRSDCLRRADLSLLAFWICWMSAREVKSCSSCTTAMAPSTMAKICRWDCAHDTTLLIKARNA
mmetsp:Transcript_10354/g.23630  ORF Transcript_10354/g.23630 Transcript_10354/m.23630 type:complete len:220 (-) Transcript_10354:579-1238(-)